jgi:RNA-binding protein
VNPKQISYLRGLAHSLNPVVMIGNNGLTDSVLKEIDVNLNAHELIKIKVMGDDRALRSQMLAEICEKSNAVAVQHLGKQLVIYRKSEKARIVISQK